MKSVQEAQAAGAGPGASEEPSSLSSSSEYAYRPLTTKHRRAGSTGTTGDEEYTTDEDELLDEADFVVAAHCNGHPKSDLARAATDLFGYAGGKDEPPTSLFEDEDDAYLRDQSPAKPLSLFAYNVEVQSTGRRRSSTDKPKQDRGPPQDDGAPQESRRADDQVEPSQPKPESQAPGTKAGADEEEELDEAEVKDQAIAKLQAELVNAHEKLKLKDEEVTRLARIRQDVEAELEELTASLFQEAHNMVREANQQKATAERLLEESRMKAEVLAAEVAALKTLVLTSTPAQPNPHLHPQIADDHHHHHHHHHHQPNGIFAKKHRRSPSHFNLKYGRENSPPDSPQKESRSSLPCDNCVNGADGRDAAGSDREKEREREKKRERYLMTQLICSEREREKENRDLGLEVDPRVHAEFLQWKEHPCVDKGDPFVGRIFREDIDLCLDFPNGELGARVRQAVLDGIIFVEAVSDKAKLGFPKKCALLEAPKQCHYRMRMGDQQENQWHCISQICRNRIIAVCDFLNYLRYIERGLVKSSVHDVYWEITRLRKEMVLARLGLALTSV